MTLDTFIFDLDGVLCEYDLQRRLQILQGISGVPSTDIHERLWASGFEDEADRGAYQNGSSYLDAFAQRLEYPITKAEWIKARALSMTPYPRVLDIAIQLSRRGTIAILTNNVPLLEETLEDVFPQVLEIFGPRIYFSCSMGTGKPDPEIYRQTAARCGALPERCLFTDDKPENVEGAKLAGMQGIHFTRPGAFTEQLQRAGVVLG